jgi:DNA polymerase IIIc chi subunit
LLFTCRTRFLLFLKELPHEDKPHSRLSAAPVTASFSKQRPSATSVDIDSATLNLDGPSSDVHPELDVHLLQQVLDENETLKKTADRNQQTVDSLKALNENLQQEVS